MPSRKFLLKSYQFPCLLPQGCYSERVITTDNNSSTYFTDNDQAGDSLNTDDQLLQSVLLKPLIDLIENSSLTRKCNTIDDQTFITLNVLRCLQNSKTGRDFLQTQGFHIAPDLSRGNYFANLSSERRLDFLRKLADLILAKYLPELQADDDPLAVFPELATWKVYAADGHTIAHATHDDRNSKGEYSSVNSLYSMDLRTGLVDFWATAKATDRGTEHELTTLKNLPPVRLRCGATKGQSTLLVYDRAIIDFEFAYNLKQTKSIYILSRWRSDLSPQSVEALEIDRSNPANEMILSDEKVTFKSKGVWRRITGRSPDGDETFVILTNQMTLPPGILNECVRLRWNIEKVFDQQEQKLDEKKAWATSETAKSIQAISICITHNLLIIFKAMLKRDENIEDTKLIKSYNKSIDDREIKAKEAGRIFPKKLYLALYRPTEISLQFIRWLRACLMRSTFYRQSVALLRPLMEAYI